MAKLVIVESPAKAKTIGKYLGKDYEVTASMGHIRDLPKSQLGIDVEHDYAPSTSISRTNPSSSRSSRQKPSRPTAFCWQPTRTVRRGHQLASGQYPGAGPPRAQPRDL